MIEIIPAIDIIDGRCVRLSQGDYAQKKVYDAQPLEMAQRYADAGVRRLHLVDLDGAKGSSVVNLRTLEQIASRTDLEIEWGGGVKSSGALASIFSAGATYAICGSIAVSHPEEFTSFLHQFPTRMILGADAREGKVATAGWLEQSSVTVADLVQRFIPHGLDQVICTDISRDGMLEGPSFGLYEELQAQFPDIVFTVSGGISSMRDIELLDQKGLRRVIVGKAIYENRITLKEIEQWSLRG